MKYYRQCQLRRGTATTTAWIEVRGARVGAEVELLPGREAWTVADAYPRTLPEDMLREQQRLSRHSLPSVEGMQ